MEEKYRRALRGLITIGREMERTGRDLQDWAEDFLEYGEREFEPEECGEVLDRNVRELVAHLNSLAALAHETLIMIRKPSQTGEMGNGIVAAGW